MIEKIGVTNPSYSGPSRELNGSDPNISLLTFEYGCCKIKRNSNTLLKNSVNSSSKEID